MCISTNLPFWNNRKKSLQLNKKLRSILGSANSHNGIKARGIMVCRKMGAIGTSTPIVEIEKIKNKRLWFHRTMRSLTIIIQNINQIRNSLSRMTMSIVSQQRTQPTHHQKDVGACNLAKTKTQMRATAAPSSQTRNQSRTSILCK